jgi:hypothetical protein
LVLTFTLPIMAGGRPSKPTGGNGAALARRATGWAFLYLLASAAGAHTLPPEVAAGGEPEGWVRLTVPEGLQDAGKGPAAGGGTAQDRFAREIQVLAERTRGTFWEKYAPEVVAKASHQIVGELQFEPAQEDDYITPDGIEADPEREVEATRRAVGDLEGAVLQALTDLAGDPRELGRELDRLKAKGPGLAKRIAYHLREAKRAAKQATSSSRLAELEESWDDGHRASQHGAVAAVRMALDRFRDQIDPIRARIRRGPEDQALPGPPREEEHRQSQARPAKVRTYTSRSGKVHRFRRR